MNKNFKSEVENLVIIEIENDIKLEYYNKLKLLLKNTPLSALLDYLPEGVYNNHFKKEK